MKYIFFAVISAFLFGASTPLGKILIKNMGAFQLASLLYFGAALGVLPTSFKQNEGLRTDKINRKSLLFLLGAIFFGGIAGPVLLLSGLFIGNAVSVSMWLNMELATTALLGFFLFNDHLDRYGWIGVLGMLSASFMLSWSEGTTGFYSFFFVFLACVSWGLDNHLTALIDDITPSQSTFFKGLIAGIVNLILSLIFEKWNSSGSLVVTAVILGAFSYGISISLYIYSAQNLGATRSQMIFSSAPFFGVFLSFFLLNETITVIQIISFFIFIISIMIIFKDHHFHTHSHQKLFHSHKHIHDDHHDHDHEDPALSEEESHTHFHTHKPFTHSHKHLPDIHHRHRHK